MPILLLDGTARLVQANAAGRALLVAGHGLVLRSGRVRPQQAGRGPGFLQALGALAEAGPRLPPVTLPLGDGQPGQRMLGVLRGLRPDPGERLHPIALHIQDPDALPCVPFGAFAALYGITPAERRVLEALVAGESLVGAAGRLGIREATARTHLSSLFGKTGVARQAALVGLVMAFRPLVAEEPEHA